ncbi:MAG: SDR family oxidoreductase [Candidatus Micrarchaeota archaeon]
MSKKPQIAVIGAGGLIGEPLYKRLSSEFDATGTYRSTPKSGLLPLDITKAKDVTLFFKEHRPDCVIHLAALTDVDLCERDPKLARLVHVTGTQNIVDACQKFQPHLIFISTEFVFDGKKGNYSENDKTNPVNVYGQTKLQAEKIVSTLKSNCIVRTATPYSAKASTKKFLGQVIEKLSNNRPVNAFADLIRSPTRVENLVDNFPRLVSQKTTGHLNLAGDSRISMYDAALQIAKVFGFDESLVKKTKSSEVKLDAFRPLDTSLNVSKAKKLGFKLETFPEGLIETKKKIRA